jgi:hypothetical protein
LVHYTLVAGAAPKAVERPGWVLVVACLLTYKRHADRTSRSIIERLRAIIHAVDGLLAAHRQIQWFPEAVSDQT